MNKKILSLIALLIISSSSNCFGLESRPLSLNEALEQALQNNLNLQIQKEEVNIAEGLKEAAYGEFDFLLTADAAYQNSELTPIISGGADSEETTAWNAGLQKKFSFGTEMDLQWTNNRFENNSGAYLYDPLFGSSLSIGLSQPLLRGFGVDVQTANLEASQKQYEASSYLVDSQAADLAAAVKKAYWNFVYAWQDIEVKKISLTLAQKLLDETKEKLAAGTLAEVDIYRPESEVARREEDLISGERAIGAAEDQIKLLINSEEWLASFSPTDLPDTNPIIPDLEKTLENALLNRPDIKASDLYTEAALIQKAKAENNVLPSLALSGRYGISGTEDGYGGAIDQSFSDSDSVWQVGLAFSAPLNNSYAKGQLLRAKAEYNQAKTSSMLLRQQVRQVVRTTVRDVELTVKAMEATAKTAFASEKSLEAEQVKFQAGRSTTLDVLVSQQAYAEALSQENLAKILYAQSRAELDRIQGFITLAPTPSN